MGKCSGKPWKNPEATEMFLDSEQTGTSLQVEPYTCGKELAGRVISLEMQPSASGWVF